MLPVSLIGMSNIGKSFWSKHLATHNGYARIDCDSMIEAKLSGVLTSLGYGGLHDVAKWMGQPPAPHYQETSARYVACEQEVMRDILDKLNNDAQAETVIDTTGSVIYTGAATLTRLRENTLIVYLEASDKHVNDLFHRYIAHPKPVIWGDSYVPQTGETPSETLKRCYQDLLRERTKHYRELAHVTVPFERHKDHRAEITALIKEFTL